MRDNQKIQPNHNHVITQFQNKDTPNLKTNMKTTHLLPTAPPQSNATILKTNAQTRYKKARITYHTQLQF